MEAVWSGLCLEKQKLSLTWKTRLKSVTKRGGPSACTCIIFWDTGESFSEALILASTRDFYFHGITMKTTRAEHGQNDLLSYCGLIDAKIRASDKDLTVQIDGIANIRRQKTGKKILVVEWYSIGEFFLLRHYLTINLLLFFEFLDFFFTRSWRISTSRKEKSKFEFEEKKGSLQAHCLFTIMNHQRISTF